MAYLKLFLTNDIIYKIVMETNRYQEQQMEVPHRFSWSRRWEPVTEPDIWQFLSLVLRQEVVGKPLHKLYWTANIRFDNLEPLLSQEYCVTTDNFYASPERCEYMLRCKTDAFGTVGTN